MMYGEFGSMMYGEYGSFDVANLIIYRLLGVRVSFFWYEQEMKINPYTKINYLLQLLYQLMEIAYLHLVLLALSANLFLMVFIVFPQELNN